MCFPTANNGTLVGRGPQAWKTQPPLWVPDKIFRPQKGGFLGHLHFLKIVATRNTGLGMGVHRGGLPFYPSPCNEHPRGFGGGSLPPTAPEGRTK